MQGRMCTQVGQVEEEGVHTGRTGVGITDSNASASGAAYWLRGWTLPGPLAREVYTDLLATMGLVSQGRPGTCWCENPGGCGPLSIYSPTALPSLFWDSACAWTPSCSRLTPAGHGAPGVQVSPKENQNKCLCPLWLPPRISAGAV